ncbi:hypothetical protein BCD91_005101 [Clostridium beijerinckii]|uniref:hypothetical protein n=1 Tax=Clostridium beijerinckii TaxID=1520 RepID=UPI00149401BD|nr:hypothetical protein [Clostridium beijerinckii]NOW93078.1 hypothetical protein [Clostridium beijerinckii]
MKEKIMLDTLTKDSVNIKKQNYVTVDGKEYLIGDPWYRGYSNSTQGRTQVQVEVTEPYLSAILAMWGDSPTVTDDTQ